MKRETKVIFLVSLIGLIVSATSFGKSLNPPTKISDIEKWIGKYPSDKVNNVEIFEMTSFRSHLRKILGEAKFKELDRIKNRGPHTPVESDQEVVHFTVCQKHKCGHTFFFLMKAKSEQIFVCEREVDLDLKPAADRSQGKWRVTWYGEKGKVTQPESHCKFYDEKTKDVDWGKTFSLIPIQIQ